MMMASSVGADDNMDVGISRSKSPRQSCTENRGTAGEEPHLANNMTFCTSIMQVLIRLGGASGADWTWLLFSVKP